MDMPISKGKTSGMLFNKNISPIGVGRQAIAYLHNKFPGKVIKTVNISGEDDPVYQFLRLCVNHQGNPYFPKIYAYKSYKNSLPDGISYRDFQQLMPGEYPPEYKSHQLIIVMERLVKISDDRDLAVKLLVQSNIISPKSIDPTIEMRMLYKVFGNKVTRRNLYNRTNDAHLKQAIRLLEPLFHTFVEDMHLGNIMLRTSPTPHLVFIDPVII